MTLFNYNISYIKKWNDFDKILYSKSLHKFDGDLDVMCGACIMMIMFISWCE